MNDDMLAYDQAHSIFQQSIRFWEAAMACAWLNPNSLDAAIAHAIKSEILKLTPPPQGTESAQEDALDEDTERLHDKWRKQK